jgi:hypothetical protein
LLVRSTVAKSRETRSAELLTKYLVELDSRGWDVAAFVSQHPDMSAALRHMLRVAARVRRAPAPTVSEAFRQRSRRRLAAAMARPPTRRRWSRLGTTWRPYRPLIAPIAAGLLVVFGLGGVWSASATALPSSPLYPAKLAIERAELATALSPDRQAEVHLAIARVRLVEAVQEQQQGDFSAAQDLIRGSDAEVAQAQAVVQSAVPPVAVATAVAQVRNERQQIATRVVAAPVTARSAKAFGSTGENPTGSAAGNATSTTSGQAPADVGAPASLSDGSPDGALDGRQIAGRQTSRDYATRRAAAGGEDNTATRADGNANAPADTADSRPGPRLTATPAPTASPDATDPQFSQADQLLHLLISQASRGDPASQQTASRYVALIRSQRPGGGNWRSTLVEHRALLEKALAAAPASTRPVLEAVYQELNRALGAPSSGPDAQSTVTDASNASGGSSPSGQPTGRPRQRGPTTPADGDPGSSTQ